MLTAIKSCCVIRVSNSTSLIFFPYNFLSVNYICEWLYCRVISGFRQGLNGLFAFLCCYVESIGRHLPTFRDSLSLPHSRAISWTAWHLKMGTTGYPETSLNIYQSTPSSMSEEWRFLLYRRILCFVDLPPCIISQISPTSCTILFIIFIYFSSLHVSGVHVSIKLCAQVCLIYLFISLLYMFRGFMCPSSGENYCICATLLFVTLFRWRLVCCLQWINPTSRRNATHTEWQIAVSHRYSNFLLMMGTWMPETCREGK